MKIVTTCFFVLLFFLMQDSGWGKNFSPADTSTPAAAKTLELNEDYSINFLEVGLRAFFALILIIVLIFLTVYLIKRFYSVHQNNFGLDGAVTILSRTPLAPKSSIYLVQVINQILVIGLTEQNMSLLSEIKDTSIIAELEANQKKQRWKPVSFKDQLSKVLKRQNNE